MSKCGLSSSSVSSVLTLIAFSASLKESAIKRDKQREHTAQLRKCRLIMFIITVTSETNFNLIKNIS